MSGHAPSSRFARWLVAALAGLAVSLASQHAWANGAMPLTGIGEAAALVVGVLALGLSALLGMGAWITALRPPDSVGGIFGRGVLGVSAVIAFAVGGLFFGIGLQPWVEDADAVMVATIVFALLFMAVEFFIGGTLYRRANARRGSARVTVLFVLSYVIGVLMALAALLVVVVSVGMALDTQPERARLRKIAPVEVDDPKA